MAFPGNRMSQLFPVTEKPPHIYLDSILLIQEIKKHPIIFDLCMPGRNLFAIFAAWENVTASLIPFYLFLNESDKAIIRTNLRKRWTWMRNILSRDILRQRLDCHIRLGWMQEMQFMVPLIIERRNQINKKSQNVIKHPRASQMNAAPTRASVAFPLKQRSSQTSPFPFVPSSSTSTHFAHNQQAISELHEIMLQTFITLFTPNRLHSQTDSDKNFLFALLQIFRKIKPERKEQLKKKIGTFFPK